MSAAEVVFDVPAESLRAKGRPRGTTVSIKRLAKRQLRADAALYPASINAEHPRPATYGACEAQGLGSAGNPCPHASCKYHLAHDVSERTGSIKANFPGRDVDELAETCALHVADRGGATLEEVGDIMNLTRERIRQLETRAFEKLQAAARALGIDVKVLLADEPGEVDVYHGRARIEARPAPPPREASPRPVALPPDHFVTTLAYATSLRTAVLRHGKTSSPKVPLAPELQAKVARKILLHRAQHGEAPGLNAVTGWLRVARDEADGR